MHFGRPEEPAAAFSDPATCSRMEVLDFMADPDLVYLYIMDLEMFSPELTRDSEAQASSEISRNQISF